MMKKHSISIACLSFLLLASWAYAKPMPQDMQALCSRANTARFSPLPATIESPSSDPLFHAIETGKGYKAVKSLLLNRHPDTIILYRMTPLLAAAGLGNWPAAQALIDSGADVNLIAPDVDDLSPLKAALSWSQYLMACKLIEYNATLPTSKADKDRLFRWAQVSTPDLHHEAAIFVDYLLMNGFDPNDQGNPRETPLMGAVSLSNIPLIKVLLKHGARLDAVTKDGRTVWTVAYKKNNPQVIKLLKQAQKKAKATKNTAPKELVHP